MKRQKDMTSDDITQIKLGQLVQSLPATQNSVGYLKTTCYPVWTWEISAYTASYTLQFQMTCPKQFCSTKIGNDCQFLPFFHFIPIILWASVATAPSLQVEKLGSEGITCPPSCGWSTAEVRPAYCAWSTASLGPFYWSQETRASYGSSTNGILIKGSLVIPSVTLDRSKTGLVVSATPIPDLR